MKFILSFLAILFFAFQSHSQNMAYADTVSTPIGDFMLETNEEPAGNISFDHQSQTASDGGEVESVNFFSVSERRAAIVIAENTSFTLKPNPANGTTNLEIKKGGEALTVRITDISGRMISTKNYYAADGNYLNVLDLSEFRPGIYFVELNTGGYYFCQKLVKE